MLRTKRTLLLSLMMIGIFGMYSLAHAQSAGSTTASVTGLVTDEQGAIIPGVVVTARNLQTNFTREVRSGEDGTFLITQLTPGTYDLMVTAEGFTTKTSRVDFVLGTTTLFNFSMALGATSDIVEVRANSIVDEGKTEGSSNIDRQRIDSLPINRRNFMDFSLTSARVTVDRVPVQGVAATSGLSFNGQQARFNNITIDGLQNNDAATGSVRAAFSQDAVQEFQIVSDNYSAEFGRAIAGVLNIVTKGGTNDLHGSIFGLVRNDTISARDVFASFKPKYKQYQFGGTLGGPIKRDKAFFFAAFERLSVKQNNIVTISDESVRAARRQGITFSNGPTPFALDSTTLLLRGDARLTPGDTLYLRYNFGGSYNGALEPFGGLVAGTSAGIQKLNDNTFAVNNTYISTKLNLVNETRFLYGRRAQDILPADPGPQVSLGAPEGTITFGRSVLLPNARNERIYQIIDNVSLSRGHHQLKFGIDFSYTDVPKFFVPFFPGGQAVFTPLNFSVLLNRPNLPFFTGLQAFDPTLRTPEQRAFLTDLSNTSGFPKGLADLPLPRAFVQGFGDALTSINEKLFSVFIQDDIKLRPDLLLKAGLRYDINRVRFVANNGGNFSPRLALSYRPAYLPHLNVRASYGIFFGTPIYAPLLAGQLLNSGQLKISVTPFPSSVLLFALPGHHFPESVQVPPELKFIPQLGQIDSNQPNLRNSYTQQASTGFDYFIGSNTAVSVTYDYVRGVKLFAVRNINPIVRPVPGSPVQSAITGRVDPTRGNNFEFESAFDSYYHALTISINRRFTNHFGFLAHYVYSKGIDDFLDLRTAIQEVVDPLNPRNERGLSLQDVRNRFVLSGIWDLNYTKNRVLTGFQLSTIINLSSGRPYNLLAGVDLNMNGDNPPGDRPLVGGVSLGRNVGITPGFANVDLRLARIVTVKERYRFQAIAEVFNLFNRVNISEVARIFPPDAQGRFNLPPQDGGRFIAEPKQFRNAFAPRQFQLGFRLTF